MMRVIVGTPPAQKLSEENSLVEDLEWEKTSAEELLSMATTMTLMGDASTFRFSGALNSERADDFLDNAKELVTSPHRFIFTEEKLLKRSKDILAKAGAEVILYAPQKKEEAQNIFAITHALAARDRKKMWLLFHESLRAGVVPEATVGMLHWKVREILGKGSRVGYSHEELKHISSELVALYHEGHRGGGELTLLLERYLLLL